MEGRQPFRDDVCDVRDDVLKSVTSVTASVTTSVAMSVTYVRDDVRDDVRDVCDGVHDVRSGVHDVRSGILTSVLASVTSVLASMTSVPNVLTPVTSVTRSVTIVPTKTRLCRRHTAVIMSSRRGHPRVARLLCGAGADKDKAVQMTHILDQVVSTGCSLELALAPTKTRQYNDDTALIMSSRCGHLAVARMIC